MKAEDTKRASILVAALRDIPGARKDLKRWKPLTTARRRLIRIEFSDDGGYLEKRKTSFWVDFDAPTMRLIIDASEKIIRDELAWMGVTELDEAPKK
jgi:hypothetical protein